MTTWNPEANDLFLQVRELGCPEERRARLDQACAGRPALRDQVEALLGASERAGDFLERPPLALADCGEPSSGHPDGSPDQPAGIASPEPRGEGASPRIGPYKLLQPIGEGGMGVVYLAEQEQPVRRQVALKIIQPGLDSRQVIARFEAERQALALMDHPNIAKVLDAGTVVNPKSETRNPKQIQSTKSEIRNESGGDVSGLSALDFGLVSDFGFRASGFPPGRPYFVMELVKGVPLTRYCDEARLSVRQRLELFVPVCEAVQHAHQKGIIHRDLKPSNLLVALYDGRPVPKVIDFGVAKATGPKLTERTLFTGFGTMIGTLEYMAPEQAELNQLDIDTRSDVYALGAVLYELLTGTTPLGDDWLRDTPFPEALRRIQEEEPPRPSTRLSDSRTLPSVAAARQTEPRRLCQLVEGDLDWITMKALAKERDRRYETANALAGDLERYLRDEPVLAGPPGAGYRLRKFVRRHKGKVAAGAGMLVLLLAGVVASTWQAVRATRAEQAAREALGQVTAEQTRTEAALAAETAARAQARQALDTLTDDVVQTLFAKQPALGEAERAFLRKVLGFYEEFTRPLGATAEARVLRARGYFKVASLRAQLGAKREAEEAYRQSLTIWQELAAEFSKVAEYRSESAHSWSALGIQLEEQGKLAEAETAFRRALAIREQLTAEFPAVPEYRRDLAVSQADLGDLVRRLGKLAEAEAAYRRALELQGKLATEFPAVPVYRHHLARSHNLLGNLLRDMGRLAETETAYQRAAAVHEQLAADFPAVPQYRHHLAVDYNNLGLVLRQLRKYPQAEATHRRALAIQEKLAAEFPALPEYRQFAARSHSNLSLVLRQLGKPAEAEAALGRAVTMLEQLATEFPAVPQYRADLAGSESNLGKLLRQRGRLAEAEGILRQAVDQSEKLAADFPAVPRYRTQLAGHLINFGNVLLDRQRPDEALARHDRAVALLEPLHEREPSDAVARQNLHYAHWGRAQALDALKRYQEARAAWDLTLELSAPADRPMIQLRRAGNRFHTGNAAEAEAEVEALTRDAATLNSILCEAACVYSLAAAAFPDDAERQERYAGRALALLRRAQAAGFLKDRRRVEHIKQVADFDALRPRDDFQKLIAELEAALARP